MNRYSILYMSRKKMAIILLLLLVSVAAIIGVYNANLIRKPSNETPETAVLGAVSRTDVSGTDTPAAIPQSYSVEEMPENIIATGVLIADSPILAQPEDGSAEVIAFASGDIVYIRASDGVWYEVITITGQEGYIKAELVNTGGFDAQTIAALAPMPGTEISTTAAETTTNVTTTTSATKSQSNDSDKNTTTTTGAATVVNPEDFPTNSSPYFIYVEKGSHSITIYAKDEKGKYTRPIRTYLTATGKTSALTPVGLFQIGGKEQWHAWGSASYSPYASLYKSGLYIHGPLYTAKNFGTLKESSVSAIGTNASSGCMRTSAEAAYFIYQFCPRGTYIKIVNGSPLGLYAGRPNVSSQYVDPATGRVPAAGVAISPDNVTIGIGQSQSLTAVVSPSLASEKACTWLSSNTAVVTVNGSGKITARSVGVATITCTTVDGGFVGRCTVTVFDPNTTSSTTTTTTTTTESTSTTESTTATKSSDETTSSTETAATSTQTVTTATTQTTTKQSETSATTTPTTEITTTTTAANTTNSAELPESPQAS